MARSRVCDRCGASAPMEESGTGSGWTNVVVTGSVTELDLSGLLDAIKDSKRKELCSTCSEGHDEWLSAKIG